METGNETLANPEGMDILLKVHSCSRSFVSKQGALLAVASATNLHRNWQQQQIRVFTPFSMERLYSDTCPNRKLAAFTKASGGFVDIEGARGPTDAEGATLDSTGAILIGDITGVAVDTTGVALDIIGVILADGAMGAVVTTTGAVLDTAGGVLVGDMTGVVVNAAGAALDSIGVVLAGGIMGAVVDIIGAALDTIGIT